MEKGLGSSVLVQDRRAWDASIREVANFIGDAGSTRAQLYTEHLEFPKPINSA